MSRDILWLGGWPAPETFWALAVKVNKTVAPIGNDAQNLHCLTHGLISTPSGPSSLLISSKYAKILCDVSSVPEK